MKDRHKKLSDRLAKTEIKHEKMKNLVFKQIITKKIDQMLDGLKVYQQAITENLVEQHKLEKRFKIDLKRYDKLVLKNQIAVGKMNKSKILKKIKKTEINDKHPVGNAIVSSVGL